MNNHNPKLRFALRYWLVRPEKEGPWQESSSNNLPRPPLRWVDDGPVYGWVEWRLGTTIQMLPLPSNVSVKDIQTTSIAWCTEISTHWITPYDCSDRDYFKFRDQYPQKDWSRLFFQNLGNDTSWPRPGLYQVLPHGNKATLNFECPRGFEDFLPRNKFRPDPVGNRRPCHLVGKTSLILALYAMCPLNTNDILTHINRFFFRGVQPRFVPASGEPRWDARDRDAYPERALVMQTGIISDDSPEQMIEYSQVLKQWENGARGPMVSSDYPTPHELHAWQVPRP